MKFKDEGIHKTIEQITHQYHLFVGNQFINYYLIGSKISKTDWVDVEDLVKSNKYYEAEGYDLNKLYEEILSFARFLTKIKEDLLPKILAEAESRMRRLNPDNQILYKMTVDNAPANITTFFDLISTLFVQLKRLDRERNGEKNMLFYKQPYLNEIEAMLNK